MSPRAIRKEARAKVNVFLRVLRARDDGYHDLESLVLPISLSDRITVRAAASLAVEVRGAEGLAAAVPKGGLNLALVAALALAADCDADRGAAIEIEKRIPVAAGLGGGSADAAAVLGALNELWGCALDIESLLEIASRIGSDVPALALGAPVLVRGRGERLEPVGVAPIWWAIVPFDFPTRSPDAFRWWDEDGGRTGPDPAPLLDAASRGDAGELGWLLFNDLEGPVSRRHPEIASVKSRLIDAGALGVVMTGSGPTVAALALDRGHARELARGISGAIVASGGF